MQHLGTKQSSCLSPTVTTYVRSWTALIIGIILAFVTFFVLFDDVLRNGAKITTDHVLTLAVLLIVTAAGHKWFSEFRTRHVFSAVGLVIVFAAGAIYLVVASGGRNAEVMIAKRNAAHFANTERERIRPLLEIEQGRKSKTQDKLQADCVEGKKGKGHCDGLRTTLSVYTMAVKGYEAELEKLGPEQEEDGSLKSTARVIVAWKGIAEAERAKAEADYVERLQLLLPYVKALLVELATVVFIGAGLGHRTTTVRAQQPTTVQTTVAPPKAQPARLTTVRQLTTVPANPEALTLQLLQRSATVPQSAVVQLFGGDKARASRFLSKLEREGSVTRDQAGREKSVTLMANLKEASRA
jgi:hypothetical protein